MCVCAPIQHLLTCRNPKPLSHPKPLNLYTPLASGLWSVMICRLWGGSPQHMPIEKR